MTKSRTITKLIVTFDVPPGQSYTNNGWQIGAGETAEVTERTLPEGFPGNLETLQDALLQIPGMKVEVG